MVNSHVHTNWYRSKTIQKSLLLPWRIEVYFVIIANAKNYDTVNPHHNLFGGFEAVLRLFYEENFDVFRVFFFTIEVYRLSFTASMVRWSEDLYNQAKRDGK